MKRIFFFNVIFCAFFLFPVNAQQIPPYSMLDPKPYDPQKDPDIDMYIGNWRESMPRTTRGSLIERDILTKGDPLHPTRKGAVLKYANTFIYAELAGYASTTPHRLSGEQEIIYIISGKGILTVKGQNTCLYPGIAILIPPTIEYMIKNSENETLSMYMVDEPVPEAFRPNADIIVRDENLIPITSNAHWVGIAKTLFSTEDGLGTLESILIDSFSAMTFFHPHSHVEGCEEIWTAIYDDIYVLLGKQIRLQKAGTAYLIPPNGNTPHSNFNVSDKLIKMFYFARYGDHEVRK